MRLALALLLLALPACGGDPPPPPSGTSVIQVGSTESFKKRGVTVVGRGREVLRDVVGVELLRVEDQAWEPYQGPVWKAGGFRVRETAGAKPQRLRVTVRLASGVSRTFDLDVAPGGYYVDNEDEVIVIPDLDHPNLKRGFGER